MDELVGFSLRLFCLFFLLYRGSPCIVGWPGTCCVDQASPKLRDLPASVSSVLGLKLFTVTMPHMFYFLRQDLMQFKLEKL